MPEMHSVDVPSRNTPVMVNGQIMPMWKSAQMGQYGLPPGVWPEGVPFTPPTIPMVIDPITGQSVPDWGAINQLPAPAVSPKPPHKHRRFNPYGAPLFSPSEIGRGRGEDRSLD